MLAVFAYKQDSMRTARLSSREWRASDGFRGNVDNLGATMKLRERRNTSTDLITSAEAGVRARARGQSIAGAKTKSQDVLAGRLDLVRSSKRRQQRGNDGGRYPYKAAARSAGRCLSSNEERKEEKMVQCCNEQVMCWYYVRRPQVLGVMVDCGCIRQGQTRHAMVVACMKGVPAPT